MQPHDLRLRLAARTLIEWNTPRTNPQYKRVLDDLLLRHPFAVKVGLTSRSSVLALDDRESVLWYLSESFESPASWPRVNLEAAKRQIRDLCQFALFKCAIGGSLMHSEIWDLLNSVEPDRVLLGQQAIVALVVPVPQFLEKIKPKSGVLAGALSRLARSARLYSTSSMVVQNTIFKELWQVNKTILPLTKSSSKLRPLVPREFGQAEGFHRFGDSLMADSVWRSTIYHTTNSDRVMFLLLSALETPSALLARLGRPFGFDSFKILTGLAALSPSSRAAQTRPLCESGAP